MITIYAARDNHTGKLVGDITNPGRKFWARKGHCEAAVRRYYQNRRAHRYDLEVIALRCYTEEELFGE